jgi:glycosyltransferase involved in cell wall biosynthesis
MTKMVHLISSLYVGGAETTLYKLLSQINRQGFEAAVVCMIESGPVGERILKLGVPVYSLGMRRGRPSPVGLWQLVRFLRQERPEILQTWLYHADLMGMVAGKLAGVRTILWNVRACDMDMSQYRPLSAWTRRVCAWLSGWPAAVIVNSEAGRVFHARSGYRPRRWVLIPNGFDTRQFKPDPVARRDVRHELGLAEDDLLVGLVARFDPMKDHETFLRAAEQLIQTHPRTHFVMVGDNITRDNAVLSALIAQTQLGKQVHLLGRRSDVPRLMTALDIATCSSYSEGFPNVVGEAMACGVPCVVTNVGDTPRIVGGAGVVVPPKDPGAIADGWRRVIAMGTEGRQPLGQAARKRIEENYSLECVVRQYEDLYSSLIAK